MTYDEFKTAVLGAGTCPQTGDKMDPEAALKKIREVIADPNIDALKDLDDIIEHFQALDHWLSHGGVLPKPWAR